LVQIGIFPPQNDPDAYTWWILLIALIYRTIFTVAGGFITALLAPGRQMLHAVILGIIGFIFGLLGLIVNWGRMPESTLWYPVLLVILAIPSVLLGAKLKLLKRQ
jgi:uncharacterized membrane protein